MIYNVEKCMVYEQQDEPLFWPIPQLRAAVEPNLSLSQNTPIHIEYRYVYGDMSIKLRSLIFWFTQ